MEKAETEGGGGSVGEGGGGGKNHFYVRLKKLCEREHYCVTALPEPLMRSP